MSVGEITFHSAFSSGVLFSQLGSGTPQNEFDHLGLFGINGTNSAIEIGAYNDTSFIVDTDGNPLDGMSYAGAIGSSGQLLNNKLIDQASGIVELSGVGQKLITDINVFDAANLGTEPQFLRQGSGTLLIKYIASGVSAVNTFNAKLFAYDAGGVITDSPPDITVYAYEINASGQFSTDVATSGKWKLMDGQGDPLIFVNHSTANGWQARNMHIWVAGISATPGSVGALNQWNLGFSTQFA